MLPGLCHLGGRFTVRGHCIHRLADFVSCYVMTPSNAATVRVLVQPVKMLKTILSTSTTAANYYYSFII